MHFTRPASKLTEAGGEDEIGQEIETSHFSRAEKSQVSDATAVLFIYFHFVRRCRKKQSVFRPDLGTSFAHGLLFLPGQVLTGFHIKLIRENRARAEEGGVCL